MESDFLYPTSLLRAVNQWQKGGDAAAKATRGRDLKQHAQTLDNPIFRQCNAMVYRRLALNQSSISKFITSGTLPETISSWTVDSGVAQGFKGGVPTEWKNGKRWFGVILAHKPTPNEVVLNLEHLWVDLTYQRTLEQTSPHQYAGGIRKMAKFPTRGCTPASVGSPFPPIR